MKLKSVPGQISKGRGWHFNFTDGYVEVDGQGTVLSGLYIPYSVDVAASNVTLKDDSISSYGSNTFGVSVRHARNVTIEHSDIYGTANKPRLIEAIKDIYGDAINLRISNDNIWHVAGGVQMSNGTIYQNYIHGMSAEPGDHVNGITDNGGSGLTIVKNTILNRYGQTDAISLFEDFSRITHVTIEDNLVAGGGYAVYGGLSGNDEVAAGPPEYVKTIGNRFSTIYYRHSGFYGPEAYVDQRMLGDVWSGNVWDATGRVISIGR